MAKVYAILGDIHANIDALRDWEKKNDKAS